MIANAPGKLVLSGAYSVLEGAPAIVAAVDRYAVADTSKPPERITEEVQAAIDAGAMKRAPWFDASALRATFPGSGDVKLGLGSSAAILVASLVATWAAEDRTYDPRFLFQAALAAHRKAQGGGSGVDVAASMFGGVIACRISPDGSLAVQPHELPSGTMFYAFASPVQAKTSDLVRRVRSFAKANRAEYKRLIGQASASAARAIAAATVPDLLAELRAQSVALAALGTAAGAPIFTQDVLDLSRIAEDEGAVFFPSGAGGGDVALYAGAQAPSDRFQREASALGRFQLDLLIGAPGAHLVSTTSPPGAEPTAL